MHRTLNEFTVHKCDVQIAQTAFFTKDYCDYTDLTLPNPANLKRTQAILNIFYSFNVQVVTGFIVI